MDRIDAAAIAVVLRQLASGQAPMKSTGPIRQGAELQTVELLTPGWFLRLVACHGHLDHTHGVMRADGACWGYGCQRDDWTLGPDSQVVDPVELLTIEEETALLQRIGLVGLPTVSERDRTVA